MAFGEREKLAQHLHSGARKQRAFEKNAVHRKLRRLSKVDPENAPEKLGNRGWTY